ncbi:unnamed protein product [Mycena citricolor]|uniref:Uncharacterized protein n=1 Tax=Mycena citricolor TaxID=2018698 RepID=A0AAD2HG93_9AGAR|nr:unnamed protein product [Mycena citricolor]
MDVLSMKTPPLTPRRRKPLVTYQSPSADKANGVTKPLSKLSHNLAPIPVASCSKSSVSSPNIIVRASGVPRKRYPMDPPLPLYHPMGPLAMSLPLLPPSHFGHPDPEPVITPIDELIVDASRRSSARSRRPVAKMRDTAVDREGEDGSASPAPSLPNVGAIAAAAALEIKEKPSPRKRRGAAAAAGAGVVNGVNGKRKRKDAEDDATYPAKRTRPTRGAAASLGADESGDDESTGLLAESAMTREPTEEAEEITRPERRSTRSSVRRRDSTASASEETTASVPAASQVDAVVEEPMMPIHEFAMRNAKEEGEVSEDAT